MGQEWQVEATLKINRELVKKIVIKEVAWVVGFFEVYKLAGPDGIILVML